MKVAEHAGVKARESVQFIFADACMRGRWAYAGLHISS